MSENKIGRNIKELRHAWGETQLDLAYAIGAKSPNSIANYEKGIRIPTDEVKTKIATHYGITVEELVNSDLSFDEVGKLLKAFALDEKRMNEVMKLTFPMMCDEECLRHPLFEEAFNLHLKILQSSDKDLDFNLIKKCLTLYFESYRLEHLPEVLVNVLQILMVLNFAYSSDGIDWNECLQKRDKLKAGELIKECFLKDCSEEASLSPWKDKIDIKKLNEVEFECLLELKKFPQYSELAEHYNASRYLFGTVDNGRCSDLNHTVGDELMRNFMNSRGEYAEHLKGMIVEFIEENEKTHGV